MKAHRQNKTDKYKQLCVKQFSKFNSQNYVILEDSEFFETLKDERNKDFCCKKCATIKQ